MSEVSRGAAPRGQRRKESSRVLGRLTLTSLAPLHLPPAAVGSTVSSVTCVLSGAAPPPTGPPGWEGRSARVYDWTWHARNDIEEGTKHGDEVDNNDLQFGVGVKGG